MKAISERFDVRKYKDACNMKGCENQPVKQVDIIELKAKGILQKRSLATVYMCKKHMKKIGLIVRNLGKFTDKGIIIRVEEKDMVPEEAKYVTF